MIARLVYWIRSLAGTRRADRATLDELAFHQEMQVQRLIADGMEPGAARRRAEAMVGDPGRVLSRVRDERGASSITGVGLDLKSSWRSLRRTPSFTLTAILTLGLGLGAVTAVFTLIDNVLLRTLPYEEPEQLVTIWRTDTSFRRAPALAATWDQIGLGFPAEARLRGSRSLESVGLFRVSDFSLTSGGAPQVVSGGVTTPGLLTVLRVPVSQGRWFLPGEVGEGAPRLVVLSHQLWAGRFGGDPGMIGQVIQLDEEPFTVIGVLPPGFALTGLSPWASTSAPPDLWVPIGTTGDYLGEGGLNWEAIGRLAPGVSLAQAEAEVIGLAPDPADEAQRGGARLVARQEAEIGGARRPIALLFGAVLLVLFIACGNVAALLLGRAGTRETELRTRSALGASRKRLLTQLLMESGILAIWGGVVGVVVAVLALRGSVLLLPAGLPDIAVGRPSLTALGAAFAVTLVTVLLFGLVPAAWLTRQAEVHPASGGESRGATRRGGLQGVMIGAQVAMALALLAGASLLVRTVAREWAVDTGFDRDRVAVIELLPLPSQFGEDLRARGAYIDRMVEAVRSTAGVEQVAFANTPPFATGPSSWGVRIAGLERRVMVQREVVSPGYFPMLGVRILAGRDLDSRDQPGTERVASALVNESMARRFWPDGSPVGQEIGSPDGYRLTVIGVVADIRAADLTTPPTPTLYVSGRQVRHNPWLVIRAQDPGALASAVRESSDRLRAADPMLILGRVEVLSNLMRESMGPQRLRAGLLLACAGTALLLAAIGIGGVVAYGVRQRMREIGVRLALGASPGSAVRFAQRQVLMGVVGGVVVGLGGAVGLSRVLRGFLYEVSPFDPVSFLMAVGMLAGGAWLASWIPARRAARVDPMAVLRAE